MKSSLWLRKAHKWLALIIAIQVVLWAVSGFYMTAIHIDIIHGDHLVKKQTPKTLSNYPLITLKSDELSKLGEVESVHLLSTPVGAEYQLLSSDRLIRIDASSGRVLPIIDERLIRKYAEYYYAGDAEIKSVTLRREHPRELGGKKKPIWQVEYDDWANSTLYFLPDSGELRSKRTDMWRWFDFLWMLHIMDYETRENVNNSILLLATGLGMLMSLIGFVLLMTRLKKGFRAGKSLRSKVQRVHKIFTLLVGLQVCIWMISGLMFSVLPQEKVSGWYLSQKLPVIQWRGNVQKILKVVNRYPDAIKISSKSILKQNYFLIETSARKFLIDANSLEIMDLKEIDIKRLATRYVRGEMRLEAIEQEIKRTTENRKFELPVWRADFSGEENPSFYIASDGKLAGVKTDTWRLFDFFWMLHIMDYSEREDFNNGLIIVAALLKILLVIAGVWLLLLTFRKTKS